MKSRKKAFTMIEVLIILTLIGFILIAELIILNTKSNQYGQPYYTAYNALRKAAYNVLADMYCPDENSSDPDCRIGPRQFPTTPQALCSRLTEFINTSEKNCENLTPINDMADNINNKAPHFIASNSFRFYFSDMKSIEADDTFGNTNSLDYFVVYVDINGEKRPNRITCEGEQILPDIVPFAVTRRGEVIPMGYPVYSSNYITAKIIYPSKVGDDGVLTNRSSGSMSYYDAVYGAWPSSTAREVQRHIDIPFSIMFSQDDIYNNSNIRQCYDGRDLRLKTEESYKQLAKDKTDEGCKGGTYSCRVVIDSSIHTRY